MRLNALFYNSEKSGNVIRSLLHVKAGDLKFTDAPDGKKTVFDVVAVAFGDNGAIADQISKTYTMVLPKEVFERVKQLGFVYDFSFPIKKSGAYQLRVALRDHESDRVGSANQFVEVPNIKKGRLLTSGIVLENLSLADWQKRNNGEAAGRTDPLTDTSLRQFKHGTVLNYGFSIYNAKILGGKPNLTYQTRIFRDGKPIFESGATAAVVLDSSDPKAFGFNGAISLGKSMDVGDYVLQITIIDNLAKDSRNSATQFVQFEIVN